MDKFQKLAETLLNRTKDTNILNTIQGNNLPNKLNIENIITNLEILMFPKYKLKNIPDSPDISIIITKQLHKVYNDLSEEIIKSLYFKYGTAHHKNKLQEYAQIRLEAQNITSEILEYLPAIQKIIQKDVQSAFKGDPASCSYEEVLLAYPGIEALIVYRIAHQLWKRNIPLIPRMMSEVIHGKTGIDIHPGAQLGKSLFIDHATGVVIGETTIIGNNVKIYQGVTLGALSVKKSEANTKRHPTIEDDVTIYSGATILGGKTVIGRGSVIGGNVWLTHSVPAGSRVYNKNLEYRITNKYNYLLDFQI